MYAMKNKLKERERRRKKERDGEREKEREIERPRKTGERKREEKERKTGRGRERFIIKPTLQCVERSILPYITPVHLLQWLHGKQQQQPDKERKITLQRENL